MKGGFKVPTKSTWTIKLPARMVNWERGRWWRFVRSNSCNRNPKMHNPRWHWPKYHMTVAAGKGALRGIHKYSSTLKQYHRGAAKGKPLPGTGPVYPRQGRNRRLYLPPNHGPAIGPDVAGLTGMSQAQLRKKWASLPRAKWQDFGSKLG